MNKLYQNRVTGEYYVLYDGSNGDLVTTDDYERYLLKQPERVISKATGLAVEHNPGIERLVVTPLQFEAHFKLVDDCTWEYNSPIEEVLEHYTEEMCDFTNKEYLARVALRYADGMEDCHMRGVLFALAEMAQAELAQKEALGTLAA